MSSSCMFASDIFHNAGQAYLRVWQKSLSVFSYLLFLNHQLWSMGIVSNDGET